MSQQLVDLGGYRLAIDVESTGSPPVVFVSALGLPALAWQPVLERLTASTTLITYDRPGCGDISDRFTGVLAEEARPVSWAADQLHMLLNSVGINEPVVLVGHSIGGLIVDAYAVRWPREVAGLILVDSTPLGFFLDRDKPVDLLVDGAEPGGQPIDLAASAREYREHPPMLAPPAVVIGSAIWRMLRVPPAEAELPAPLIELDQRFQLDHLKLAERWRAHLVIAHDAGHMLHDDAPQLVAATIDATVSAIRHDKPVELDLTAVRDAGGASRTAPPPALPAGSVI